MINISFEKELSEKEIKEIVNHFLKVNAQIVNETTYSKTLSFTPGTDDIDIFISWVDSPVYVRISSLTDVNIIMALNYFPSHFAKHLIKFLKCEIK